MAPKFDQTKLNWIHILNTITELPPKTYLTIKSENVKPNWIRWNHEHTSTAKVAPKSYQTIELEAIELDNMKPYWIHEHTIIVEMAPKSNKIIVLETVWIHDYSTSAELASRPKKQIINPIIEMVQRRVPECFSIHYSATTKIRSMKMINNTKSFTLPFFFS